MEIKDFTEIEQKQIREGLSTAEISNKEAADKILALVPESRKEQGLYLLQDIKYNTTIEVLDKFIKNLNVNSKKEAEITQEYIDMMATKTPSQEQVIGNLSGGNQQKVILARWLLTKPKVLLLDEPTRGIDVGAKEEIYLLINELAASGLAVVVISSELPEVIGICDRIITLCEGRLTGEISKEEATQEILLAAATNRKEVVEA